VDLLFVVQHLIKCINFIGIVCNSKVDVVVEIVSLNFVRIIGSWHFVYGFLQVGIEISIFPVLRITPVLQIIQILEDWTFYDPLWLLFGPDKSFSHHFE